MVKDNKSLRSAIGRVRGLGSAKNGTHHWWMQRVTALVMIPFSLYTLSGFFQNVVFGNRDRAVDWLSVPPVAVFVFVAVAAAFHHAVSGLQVVIEDYVHSEPIKLASLLVIRIFAVVLVLLTALFLIKIVLFSLVPMAIENAQPKQ